MPDIKVTTWNIEHMNKWFTNDATPQIVPEFQTIVDRAAGVFGFEGRVRGPYPEMHPQQPKRRCSAAPKRCLFRS
jgi:hypothetical protein